MGKQPKISFGSFLDPRSACRFCERKDCIGAADPRCLETLRLARKLAIEREEGLMTNNNDRADHLRGDRSEEEQSTKGSVKSVHADEDQDKGCRCPNGSHDSDCSLHIANLI